MDNTFSSVEEAVNKLNLDRRHKWEVWNGSLCYPWKYTSPCSGCYGTGCDECGYKGKRIDYAPVPARTPDGELVKIVL